MNGLDEIKQEINNTPNTVPYVVYEGSMARLERQIKRLWIVIIIAITLLALTNLAWLYYESQYETISYTQDGEGLNNINTGTQGDVNGAESENPPTKEQAGEESTNPQG